ncbi:MAG: MarR family winged helix-turn-helix transcriptional regulator [Steroidobacteraceae bacterium]
MIDVSAAGLRAGDGPGPRGDSDAAALRAAIESFYFAYRAFTAGPDRILDRRGLGRVHHRILYFVGRNSAVSVKELLDILEVTKQALNSPLRQLIEMGLIAAAIPPHDRRVRQLSLTGEGSRLEAQLTATQTKLLSEAFAAAGSEANRGWLAVMRTISGGRRQ